MCEICVVLRRKVWKMVVLKQGTLFGEVIKEFATGGNSPASTRGQKQTQIDPALTIKFAFLRRGDL